jgi:transposase
LPSHWPVNPAKIKAFANSELSRAKTYKADAKLIARYAFTMRPRCGHHRPKTSVCYKLLPTPES